ncbi:PilZ domain-containing protein [Halobacillus litoralis]|uniref:PilZ domain-containing protein n=1 Tax=Halobacillus litoralis TaxID=45668 RepID=UPI001CD34F09|nr:PilZ domain-containing protein [Halobacillus litoralis]MCA0972283.1 PilZ domain-containing protein [Halobacillus litoralis]
MTYLLVYQIVLSLALLTIIVLDQKMIRTQKKKIVTLQEEKNRMSLKYQKAYEHDQRSNFRIDLNEKDSKLIIESIDGDLEHKLKGKVIGGYIDNISVSGIKFVCPYNLPVSSNIKVKSVFTLGTEYFELDAVMVRKEENVKNKQRGYGIKFVDVPHRDQGRLNMEIRRIDSERRRKITRIS